MATASKTTYATKSRRILAADILATDNDGIYEETIAGEAQQFMSFGDLNAENCKIYTTNSAAQNAAALAAACARSDVQYIVFNNPKGATYPLTGTIDCNGKVLKFRFGNMFSGTFTLNNPVIDAPYNQQIFPVTVTLTNAHTATERVSVKWFSAVGSGVVDDQPALQKAGDTVIANPAMPRTLYFPRGTYLINKELFYYSWTGSDYTFFSLNLLGQEGAYFNNTLTEAVIQANHQNTFAIGVQMCRSSKFKGLVIKGNFHPTGSSDYGEYVSRDYATWASAFGVADHPTKPYSGIVLDPVDNSGTLGSSGRYPGLEDYYRGTGANTNSGCSALVIEQCSISNFAIDIMVSPNSITSNCENVHIIDCRLEVAKACVAYGQDQTKDNYIIRCISWDRVHSLVDTLSYGRGTGQPAYVDAWNVAGDVIQLFTFNPLRAACNWRNLFAESLWRLGDGDAGAGFALECCTINFDLRTEPNLLLPQTHLTGSKHIFKGCVIKYYDNNYDKRMRLTGADYRFEDCELDKFPLFNPAYTFLRLTPAQFINCISGDGTIGRPHYKGQWSTYPTVVAYGHMIMEDGGLLSGSSYDFNKNLKIEFDCAWPCREIRLGPWPITVNPTTREGTITGLVGSNMQYVIAVGDYITNEAGLNFGRVTSIDRGAGSLTLTDVPHGISSTSGDLIAHWVEKVRGQFVGDVTNASPTLTNCEYDTTFFGPPQVGDRLRIGHSFMDLIVDAISGTNITMSWNADYTTEDQLNPWVQLGCQKFEMQTLYAGGYAGNLWPVLIPEGAIFRSRPNNYNGGVHVDLVCVKSGFSVAASIGKTHQALFRYLTEIPSATFTTSTAIAYYQRVVLVDTTANDVTISVVPVDGWWWVIKKISSDANRVIITGYDGALLDGSASSRDLAYEGESMFIASDPTALYIIN